MDDMINMGDDPVFCKNLHSTVDASMQFTKAVLQCGGHEPGKITLALAALSGPIAAVSLLCAKDGKNEHVTQDQVMFAGLLVAHCFEPLANSNVALQMSPGIVLDAINAWEKLTGKRAEDCLNADMVSAARTVEKVGADTFAAFMEAKRNQSKMN